MALPSMSMSWPPEQMSLILPAMDKWSAWYANTPERLQQAYGNDLGVSSDFFVSQQAGQPGVGSRVARWFVGKPNHESKSSIVPVPLTGEICQASADLLFSQRVFLTVEDKTTQARLDTHNESMHSTLAEAGELGSALGGVYLRVTWDQELADMPFLTAVDADTVIPEFHYGRLTAATIWQTVQSDGNKRWRHLERHELQSGNGMILHGLYLGSVDKLGTRVPFDSVPETKPLAALDGGVMDTLTPGLAIVYVPNQTPNRIWRHDPLGKNLGRPDIDGSEHLLDAYAETMTSWMRDIRLGKARVMIAKNLTQNLGPGKGSAFDEEQEFYTKVAQVRTKDDSLSNQIEQVQFGIRYEAHGSTARMLTEQIIQSAGYSLQTLGVPNPADANSDTTATEIESRQQRSMLTRSRKIRAWKPALAQIVQKLLAVDQTVFGAQIEPSAPRVEFQNAVEESNLDLAQTAQLLFQSESASAKVRVGLVHPDWTGEQINAEAKLILAETGGGASGGLIDATTGTPAEQ